jgi:catechol 2,3-dioxygenase-like lactoylglutathione lyase family enzyme
MLHHVTLEVSPGDLGRAAEFWASLGFTEIDVPGDLPGDFLWFERGGTQVHLMASEQPTIPREGHPAVIVPDFELTIERLLESGFEVTPKRERWGSARAQALAPSGHKVELMEAAPPAAAH